VEGKFTFMELQWNDETRCYTVEHIHWRLPHIQDKVLHRIAHPLETAPHTRQGATQDSTIQGGHAVWKSGKTGKMVKTNSLQGKIREFQNLNKIRELSGNFTKSEEKKYVYW